MTMPNSGYELLAGYSIIQSGKCPEFEYISQVFVILDYFASYIELLISVHKKF